MKNFVLIGAAGYIAPRHMKAIKEKIPKNALAPSLPPTTLRIVTSATHVMEDIDTLLQSLHHVCPFVL